MLSETSHTTRRLTEKAVSISNSFPDSNQYDEVLHSTFRLKALSDMTDSWRSTPRPAPHSGILLTISACSYIALK